MNTYENVSAYLSTAISRRWLSFKMKSLWYQSQFAIGVWHMYQLRHNALHRLKICSIFTDFRLGSSLKRTLVIKLIQQWICCQLSKIREIGSILSCWNGYNRCSFVNQNDCHGVKLSSFGKPFLFFLKKRQGKAISIVWFRGPQPLGLGPLMGRSPFGTGLCKRWVRACAFAVPHAPAASVVAHSPTRASNGYTHLPLTQNHPLPPPQCWTTNPETLGSVGLAVISLSLNRL